MALSQGAEKSDVRGEGAAPALRLGAISALGLLARTPQPELNARAWASQPCKRQQEAGRAWRWEGTRPARGESAVPPSAPPGARVGAASVLLRGSLAPNTKMVGSLSKFLASQSFWLLRDSGRGLL